MKILSTTPFVAADLSTKTLMVTFDGSNLAEPVLVQVDARFDVVGQFTLEIRKPIVGGIQQSVWIYSGFRIISTPIPVAPGETLTAWCMNVAGVANPVNGQVTLYDVSPASITELLNIINNIKTKTDNIPGSDFWKWANW